MDAEELDLTIVEATDEYRLGHGNLTVTVASHSAETSSGNGTGTKPSGDTELSSLEARIAHLEAEGWLARCREVPHRSPAVQPGVADLSRIMGRLAVRGMDRALHIEQWFLAYRLGGGVSADLKGFTRLMPPKDRDWADPFVVEKSGRYYIFFEELPYAERKAHISMIELDAAGNASKPQRVLEADHHLSYPFLFEHDGQLYMLPESAKNRSVELYRCVDFPLVWKRERIAWWTRRSTVARIAGGCSPTRRRAKAACSTTSCICSTPSGSRATGSRIRRTR